MWNVVLLIVFILRIWFGYQLVKILFQVALVLCELFWVTNICGPQSLVRVHSIWDF
jgi:hypothetical protein